MHQFVKLSQTGPGPICVHDVLNASTSSNGHLPMATNTVQQCNTLICRQLAMHRVSSCGTHRVVTHSQKTRFSAHHPAQTRHTAAERELLSTAETLKEHRNVLLGQQIEVFTDHKNLVHKHFNAERVVRW